MPKNKKTSSNLDWDTKGKKKKNQDTGDWETVSTGGFHPMWKPTEDGEDVIFIPLAAQVIQKHGKVKAGGSVICELVGGSSDAFFSKDVKKGVGNGDKFVIPLSYNLLGNDKLGVWDEDEEECNLSDISVWLLANRETMRIVFDGKVKGGGGSVKQFTIQLPKGVREKFLSREVTKRKKK